MKKIEQIHFKDEKEFRKWLEKNHDREEGIWMLFYKKETGVENIEYDSAVEQALCFGWIDGMIKKLDNEKYLRRFTPRRRGSKWSSLNIKRAEKMIEQGNMTEKGMELFNSAQIKDRNTPHDNEISGWVMEKIECNEKAYSFFKTLAPSYKKIYLGYVLDAKKIETQQNRLEKVIKRLEENLKPGMKI